MKEEITIPNVTIGVAIVIASLIIAGSIMLTKHYHFMVTDAGTAVIRADNITGAIAYCTPKDQLGCVVVTREASFTNGKSTEIRP